MRFDTVIKGGNVVTPAGTFTGDIGIAGEKTAALGMDLGHEGAKIVDARGHHVIPGVLDVHVHLELPFCGTVSADDYRTGTRAGARGGATTVLDVSVHLQLPFCGPVSADHYRTAPRPGARGGVTPVIDFAIPPAGGSLSD